MIVDPGMLQEKRFGQQRRDEVAADELAGAVDEEAAIGVAVPGDADVGLLGDDALDDVAAVFLDERVGLVIGKPAVDLEAEARRLAGEAIEELRRDEPAHAAAGVEHDVEGPDDAGIDERHHVRHVGVEHVVGRHAAPVAAGGGRRSCAIMSRISEMPSSPLSGNASWRTIFMPLYCLGLCDAVIWTPPSWPIARDREVQHVGRNHAVVDDVGALRRGAVDERRRERRRRQAHVAADRDALGLADRRRTPRRSRAPRPR